MINKITMNGKKQQKTLTTQSWLQQTHMTEIYFHFAACQKQNLI